jgi:hypothetical protein
MQFCVSANGNIVEFQSPAGSEHLRVQTIAEGYTICDRPNLIEAPINHGFDMAFDSGGFDASTVIAAPPPAVFGVTRTTSDRVYRVTQTFLRDPSDLAVAVTMTVTNRTFRPRFGVSVSRQFDGDLDNGPFDDRYLRTADTVLGWQSSTGHGLELTAQSSTTAHRTFVQRFSDWFGTGLAPPLYRGCFFDDEPTPTATGDFVGAIVYNLGVLGPFQSKSVTFLYHRI